MHATALAVNMLLLRSIHGEDCFALYTVRARCSCIYVSPSRRFYAFARYYLFRLVEPCATPLSNVNTKMIGKRDHSPTHNGPPHLDSHGPPPPPYQRTGAHVQENTVGTYRATAELQGLRANEPWAKDAPAPYAGRQPYTDHPSAPDLTRHAYTGYGSQSQSPYAPLPGPSQAYGNDTEPGNHAYDQAYARSVVELIYNVNSVL